MFPIYMIIAFWPAYAAEQELDAEAHDQFSVLQMKLEMTDRTVSSGSSNASDLHMTSLQHGRHGDRNSTIPGQAANISDPRQAEYQGRPGGLAPNTSDWAHPMITQKQDQPSQNQSTALEQVKPKATGIFSAFALNIAFSFDDMIWLLPFLTTANWRSFAAVYVLTLELLVLLAWSGGALLQEVMDAMVHEAWKQKFFVKLACVCVLVLYTIKSFKEWHDEQEEAEDHQEVLAKQEKQKQEDNPQDSQEDGGENVMSGEDDHVGSSFSWGNQEGGDYQAEATKNQRRGLTYWDLFIVTICGSADNLCMYISMMSSHTLQPVACILGTGTVAMMVVVVALGLSSFRYVLDAIDAVPLWVIFTCVTTYLLISAIQGAYDDQAPA